MSRTRLAALGLALCLALPASAEGPTADPRVTLAFVGDINLDGLPGNLVRRGGDPFAPFAALLDGADIRVGNLECVIATRGEPIPNKLYTFRAHPRTLIPLKRHFDALSLANNHSGDFGPAAFGELLTLVERHGLRVALLGYNEFLPRSFEADYDRPGVAWSEDEQVQRDIIEARRRYSADLVVPFMHWGWENEPVAGQRGKRRLARLMIDAGADAVVGSHPHVVQDTETYRGRPIVYSLGNFVFDGFTTGTTNTGWLLRLDLDREGVRAWRTDVAHLDGQGIPHPAPTTEGTCWKRGQAEAAPCGAR